METQDIAKALDLILQTPEMPANVAFMLCKLRNEIAPALKMNVPQCIISGETWNVLAVDQELSTVHIMRVSDGYKRTISIRDYYATKD